MSGPDLSPRAGVPCPKLRLFALCYLMINGFVGPSSAVDRKTLFVSRYSLIASMPLSRPSPNFFMPPKGTT